MTQWYPPEPQELLSELAASLASSGYDVQVVTGFPNWPSGTVYPGYKIRLFHRELWEGIPVTRVALFPDHSRSALKRSLNFLSFGATASLLPPFLVRRPDIIHCIHPPLTAGLAAVSLSKMWGIPFTYEIQDMWPETLRATGMIHSENLLGAIGSAARLIYAQAARIRVISQGFKQNLIAKGVPHQRIEVIPNWVDTDFYKPSQPNPEFTRLTRNRFVVMFGGNVGLAQGLETVVAAAKLLRNHPRILFVIVGDGVDLARIKELAAETDSVHFLGRAPADRMPGLYSAADVLLLHLRPNPLFEITIPHKVLAYLAAGKPIVAAMAGETAQLIDDAGAGVTCQPGDPRALASRILELSTVSHESLAAMGRRGRALAMGRFARPVVAEQVDDFIEAALAESDDRKT